MQRKKNITRCHNLFITNRVNIVTCVAASGGEDTWRNYLTLPNILKEFNPGLKGFSVGKGEFLAPNSHMNVAFPVSADYDAYRQAQFLVKKMKKDPQVDFKNDWKVCFTFQTPRYYLF